MPLLMCPNDNTAMQTLDRGGVQFDMCPSCRGVWLDRGELEKLMEGAAAEAAPAPIVASAPQPQVHPQHQPAPQQAPWGAPMPSYGHQPHQDRGRYRDERHRDERYRDDRHRNDDYAYRKKKKRMDIFDIFD